MTIICGLKYENKYILACDSRITEGSVIVSEQYDKIFKDVYFHTACAGQIGEFKRFIRALQDTEGDMSDFKVRGKEDDDTIGMDAIVIHININGDCFDVSVLSVTQHGTETYSALDEGYCGDVAVLGSGATAFLATWRYLSKRGQPNSYEATIKRLKECFTNTARLDNCCNDKIQIITYTLED
jgi:hypothetical protein